MGRAVRLLALSSALVVCSVSIAAAGNRSFSLPFPSGRVHVEQSGGVTSIRVDDPGFSVLDEPGQPALPYRVVSVLLPQGEDVTSFHVTAGDTRVLTSADHLATATSAVSEDGRPGMSAMMVSGEGDVFPAQSARLLSTGILHGYTIASFAVYAVRVEDGQVVASDVTLDVESAPSARIQPTLLQRLSPQIRARARDELASMVINPRDAGAYVFNEIPVAKRPGGFQPTSFPSLEGSAVDYVIVTPDSMAAAYQTLADWKTAKGVPTVVRTTEWIAAHYRNGSDIQETIRNFVIDAYTKWGITYVLLGGDTAEIPPRLAYSGFYDGGQFLPADMYFGCLDGDWNGDHDDVFGEGGTVDSPDLYAEVYVGRLPSDSVAEANLMISKVMNYETPVNVNNGKRVLLLGEVLFPMGWVPPQPITLNGADLTEYVRTSYMTNPNLYIARMYETEELFPGSVDENRVAVIDSLNNGYDHVVHVGHGFRFNMEVGDVSIVNSDADALTNGNKQFCLFMLNCTGAAYNYSCIAEHFLRNPNGGAVSVIGANNSAFPNASQYYMNEYYRLLFQTNVVHLGEVFARSRLPRTPLAESGDYIDLWTHYIYTLLGDPEMPMWTGPVTTLALSHPSSVATGTNSITVTVTDNGNPVDSAMVCLSKDDEDYQVGSTDGSGQVTLSFRAETTGSITVVATGRNHARATDTITVTNSAAYVRIDNITVDDDNVGGTSGNGNGIIEGGEIVDLGFTLRNTGSASTGTVSVVLRSGDGAATVVDSTASGGTIAPGGTGVMTGGCRVELSASTPDEHSVPYVLVIKDNGTEMWRDTFKRDIHQPKLDLVRLRIDDSGTGNGNGVVDAGEQFKLYYKIKNFGTGAFPGGTLVVTDLDAGFNIINGADTYGTAASLSEIENTAGLVLVEPSIATGHRLGVTIVDAKGRNYSDTIELRPPQPPTALVVDPSLGPDKLRVSWTPSISGDASHYNLYQSLASGGPYTLANPDPVSNAFYVSGGLSGNTQYFFRATTIDTSGNESAVSLTYSGSTNPPQLSGWPIAMKVETTSSPAVGDIDGDGNPDIVECADKVYAWHSNGIEMVDGDHDAQTWGVLSSLGSSFVSHPALARMDLDPGLDIIAASRDTKEVYIFKHDGTVLPGWPRPVENTIRAGLVAGDLDGDGKFEVIAVDELGVIYVWHADGTELIDGDSNPATQGVFYRMTGCTLNYSTPAVADIDADGTDELIVGSQGDQVFVFNGDGTVLPGFPFALTGDISGSPAVGDVDGDGWLDIVVYELNGPLHRIDHNGVDHSLGFFTNGASFFSPSPAIGDVMGDSKLEVFVPAKNGRLYGVDYAGNYLPNFPVYYNTSGQYTESSPVIADLDGDGSPDILIGDESRYIHAFNMQGQPVAGFPLFTNDAMRGVPTVSDLDGDGQVDLVAAGWDKNVYVWDSNAIWNPADAPWPRFHANLHNNGRINYVVPTPVAGTRFTFTVADERIHLEWNVPVEAGRTFDVQRAVVDNGATGGFQRIARGVNAGVDGRVQVTDAGVDMGSRYVYRLSGETGVVYETGALYVPVSHAELGQNYPNPFNPVTKIDYWVPDAPGGGKSTVSVVVYDVRGARVRTLASGPMSAGRYVAQWDGRDEAGSPVSSGIYFYRMVTGSFSGVRKMVLLK
ncbi:MAG TPA: C25 family cysteine peptidase [Candidatus Krumholzibacteria bacterium]|nr:C25 family cysteine peptidase [Candidatus Krumholzibacteria bacterium]